MARRIERIPIVMDAILSTDAILGRWLKESRTPYQDNAKLIRSNSWRIYKYWTENPDQRFGQMLFNLGFTNDGLYHIEATEWLVSNNFLRKQDVTFWGTYGLKEEDLRKTEEYLKKQKPKHKDLDKNLTKKAKFELYGQQYCSWRHLVKGTMVLKYKPISDLDTDHIETILSGPRKVGKSNIRELFEEELAFRNSL